MPNPFRRALIALVALSTPALADDAAPITHTNQLVVVTPNPPIVITNGAAGPASAGPGATAPTQTIAVAPNGAPQNEDWSNVSHINGSVVKVGERGDYILKYRKTNIATNPIGWMFGFYGVSVSRAIHSNVAIRVDANLFNASGESGYEFGVSVPIYFRRVYSGPFIEPGVITRGFDEHCSGCGDESMFGPEVLIGWHWTFDSGLNMAMAIGAARNVKPTSEYGGSDAPEPAGYFRVGYAF